MARPFSLQMCKLCAHVHDHCKYMYVPIVITVCTHTQGERTGSEIGQPTTTGLETFMFVHGMDRVFYSDLMCFCSLACCFHGREKADCHYFRCSQYRYVTHVYVHDNSKHGKCS